MRNVLRLLLGTVAVLMTMSAAASENWQRLSSSSALVDLLSDIEIKRELKNGAYAIGRYRADGSGELEAWGSTFDRQWRVQNEDQACFHIDTQWQCYFIEKHWQDNLLYRAVSVVSGDSFTFMVVSRLAKALEPHVASSQGGAAEPSADEVAKKLANPNAPLASLTMKLQYKTYQGDLPKAEDQDSTTLLFQPSLPFPLAEKGTSILFRPAIPLQIDQPSFEGGTKRFDEVTGLGDISFDLAYAMTSSDGILTAVGVIATLPTATEDELGLDRYALGPELLIGKIAKNYVLGAFPNHQWDVGGSGDAEINLTNVQIFAQYLPGGAWNVGSSPVLSYDHVTDQATVPVNLNLGKTVILSGRPWKLSMEFNYYVEQADAFGPEFMLGVSITPVVENVIAEWFK